MTSPPEKAILHTVVYADVFDYALTLREVHHYLIAHQATPEAVQAALDSSAWLGERITRANGYLALRDREGAGAMRDDRQATSARLWPAARRWAARIGSLPFVRMVAVTGSLAMDNAPAGDDIDYLIITAPGRVWLARALVVVAVRLARQAGVGICPNYVLSEAALEQQQRNLYTAHDLAQMVPLVGHDVYHRLRAANDWCLAYLPQARRPLREEADGRPRGAPAWLKVLGERLLGGRLGDALERWERNRKLRRWNDAARQPESAAEIDADHVKGHFRDNGQRVLREFAARAARYDAEASP